MNKVEIKAKRLLHKLYLLHGREINLKDLWIGYYKDEESISVYEFLYSSMQKNYFKANVEKFIITDEGIDWIMG